MQPTYTGDGQAAADIDAGFFAGLRQDGEDLWRLYSQPDHYPYTLTRYFDDMEFEDVGERLPTVRRTRWTLAAAASGGDTARSRHRWELSYADLTNLVFADTDGVRYVHSPLKVNFADHRTRKIGDLVEFGREATVQIARLLQPTGRYELETAEICRLRNLQAVLLKVAYAQQQAEAATARQVERAAEKLEEMRERLRTQFGFGEHQVEMLLRIAQARLHPREALVVAADLDT